MRKCFSTEAKWFAISTKLYSKNILSGIKVVLLERDFFMFYSHKSSAGSTAPVSIDMMREKCFGLFLKAFYQAEWFLMCQKRAKKKRNRFQQSKAIFPPSQKCFMQSRRDEFKNYFGFRKPIFWVIKWLDVRFSSKLYANQREKKVKLAQSMASCSWSLA